MIRESTTQPLVLHHGGGVHSLAFIEGAVGKQAPLRAHFQPTVREVIDVDVLAAELFADYTAFQDELLAIVSQGELIADMTLIAMAQHIIETIRLQPECLMQVVGFAGRTAKRSLKRLTKPVRKAFPASMLDTFSSRSSLTSRSCNVRLTRSTRPFAWLE